MYRLLVFRNVSPRAGSGIGSLVARILALLAGVAVLAAAFFVGAVFLVGIVGLALLLFCFVMLRAWWLRRELRRSGTGPVEIDGEYTVIHREDVSMPSREKRHDRGGAG